MNEKEAAAMILQAVICDAVCAPDMQTREDAREWLLLYGSPSIDEIIQPEPMSCIGACRMLGLDWHWLRKTMRLAVKIDTIPAALVTKRHLTLVHNNELAYNRVYEQETHRADPKHTADEADNDRDRARQAKRRKLQLHLQVVQTSRR